MNTKPSVKILIGYHKPAPLFKSDILTPIHLGRVCVDKTSKDGKLSEEEVAWMYDNMIGDDTGDNISLKNRNYNEMTGIYWAWKNYDKLGSPDYIGFMHYRRLFYFTKQWASFNASLEEIVNKTQIFNDDLITETVAKYDLLHPEAILSVPPYPDVPREMPLKEKMKLYPLKNIFDIVYDKFPNWREDVKQFADNNKIIYNNMFIMKKELFFEYCEFVFTVLTEYEKVMDYSKDHPRRIGFDSEYMTGLFLYTKSRKYRSAILPKCCDQDVFTNYKYTDPTKIERWDTKTNSCTFTNFKIEKERLAFDVIVSFKGIVPKTNQYVKYDNQIFPFEAEFSEPLEYDKLDVYQMVERYIKQAKLSDIFQKITIDLKKEGKIHDFNKGENYLCWNSYGIDSYSIYLTFRDKLKERMIEFSWTSDKQHSYITEMINRCPHYRKPVVIYFKHMLESVDLLWNPCNSTYLGHLLYKKFNIKLSLYGDADLSYFQPYNIKNINQVNIAFYQTELISLYIAMILGDKQVINSMLFDNEESKTIRKTGYLKILTDYVGVKFEDYIDINRLNRFKEKIKNKTFDYYFKQESTHPTWLATNIYFFKDELIKALIELFYSSEKDIVKQRFQQFFEGKQCGHPLYNGNYFTISYQAFKKYTDNLEGSQKELEKIMCEQYKLLHLFNPQECPVELCSNTNLKDLLLKNEALSPAFSENNIPVVLACDNNYAPYAGATINSIIQNATAQNNYDIILMHTDITSENQQNIQSLADGKDNICIRIVDISESLQKIKKDLFIRTFYSIATYFRILIPSLCRAYDKVLYLDTDVVACQDVADLYHTDIGENWLGATPDVSAIYQSNVGKKMPDRNLTYQNYFKEVLGLTNINKYFQAGVLIINVTEFKKHNIYNRFITKLREVKTPFYVDQDILNSICYGHVKFLPAKWNHVTHTRSYLYLQGFIPQKMYQDYEKARKNPAIIHFTGGEKPWHNPKWVLANKFWQYVARTPFAEKLMNSILKNYGERHINWDIYNIDMNTVVYTHQTLRKKIKKCVLNILKKFALAKNKKKIQEKIDILNKNLNKAKTFTNKFLNFYSVPAQEASDEELIQASGLFDFGFYNKMYKVNSLNAIKHYCQIGWRKGFNPSTFFNSKEYSEINHCNGNPLVQWIRTGKKMGDYVFKTPSLIPAEADIAAYHATHSEKRKNQVIYTCLTGNYDALVNHYFIHPDWSYICFTDNTELLKKKTYGIWTIKPLVYSEFDNILNNRYHKILPHKIFDSTVQRSIYVDSNCNILSSFLFDTIEQKNKDLLAPIHFQTSCLYTELEWYNRHHPEQKEKADKLYALIRSDNFPENWGMNENNILYRVHKNDSVCKIMEMWWEILKNYVPRDQLSFSYCLWKNHIAPLEISIPNARIDLKNFQFYPHKKGEIKNGK